MSPVTDQFGQFFGAPDPATAPGLRFATEMWQERWERIHSEIGSGWFGDGFLYLFGEGLEELRPCLDAWSFLLPPAEHRMIVGRNAYGALLLLDNPESVETQKVQVLDPFTLTCWQPLCHFTSLIGRALPERELETFIDDSAYHAWRAESGGRRLELTDVLGVGAPHIAGGKLESDNLELQNIVDYYRMTGAIYSGAFTVEEKSWAPEHLPADIRAQYTQYVREAVPR